MNDEPEKPDADGAEDEIPAEARAAIMRLIEEIDALKAELQANNARIAELEDLADTDPLTPVVNRRAFAREIDRTRAYVERYGGAAALIYLDIDGLKRINDEHGHAAGDAALMAVAGVLVDNVRSSDLVGRLGGDEFGIVLSQADVAAAEEKVKALAGLIGEIKVLPGGEAGLSASFGIAAIAPGTSADAVLAAADAAMYEQKKKMRRT